MTSEHQCSNCVPNEEIIDTAPLYRSRSDREPQIVDMLVSVQTQYVPRHEADALRAELAVILAAAHKLAEAARVCNGMVSAAFEPGPKEFEGMKPMDAWKLMRSAHDAWLALNVGGREP